MNKNLTRYYSRHTRQQTHMELADGLKTCMISAIKEWAVVNGECRTEYNAVIDTRFSWAVVNGECWWVLVGKPVGSCFVD